MENSSKWKGWVSPLLCAFVLSAAWFYVGTQYGYANRDSDLYSRGYKDGQTSIFVPAKLQMDACWKQVDRLKEGKK